MLVGCLESQVTEYEASEAGQASGSERLANELMKTRSGSIMIIAGVPGLFKSGALIRFLQNAVQTGWLSVVLCVISRYNLVQAGRHAGPTTGISTQAAHVFPGL